MYIKDFHIEEFGPLKDFSVNDIPCGMAVFLGNNEAGKSSTMEFVRAMLMGIPTKRNTLTQMIRNSKGGNMRIHDMHHGDIDIIRNFSSNPSLVQLYDEHGNVHKNNILTEIMPGISRDIYRIIYGFNLLELQNVNNFHGSEVFNTILGASFGLGLRGPVVALENIQERIDSIYNVRGKNTVLQKLFDAWNTNKNILDIAFEEVKQFDILQRERVALDENLSILRDKKIDIIKKNDELNLFIGLYGQWEKWLELQNTIASLPSSTVSFPDNAELVLERILEQKKIKKQNLEDFKSKQNKLAIQQEAKQTDSLLLAQYDALKSLMEDKGSYRQALAEITPLKVKVEQFSHVLEGANSRLKENWQMLDGQNLERNALMGEGMSYYIEKIPHGDVFLNELIPYESKIIEAEAYAQSAKTALEYAQRNTKTAEEKRQKIEENIRQKSETDALEQEILLSSHANAYDTITEQISLTKEAVRLLPNKLNSIRTTFENWNKQIKNIGINDLNDLDTYTDEANKDIFPINESTLVENSVLFTLIKSETEKNYYTQISKFIGIIQEQRVKILPVAQKITEEESALQILAEKIERITHREADLDARSQMFDASFLSSLSEENNIPATDRDGLEIKSQALQKLQTINELRTQSIYHLKDLHVEQKPLEKTLKEKTISNFALVPGILCLGLGLPLFILRLLNGENLISFGNFFAFLNSSIYVPLWLPILLLIIASLSIYLPISRKLEVEKDQHTLNELEKDIEGLIENLRALKREEISIISHVFNVSEEQQAKNYEQAKTNLSQKDGLDFIHSLELEFDAMATEENLPVKYLVGKKFAEEIDPILEDKILSKEDKNSIHTDSNEDVPLPALDDAQEEYDGFFGEEFLNKNSASVEYILKCNVVCGEISKILQQNLQNIWEQEYARFIATEQQNDAKAQADEKRVQLLNEKENYEELLEENHELLEGYKLEWDEFFQQYLFKQGPNPKDMEVFFLRIDACANIQKRLNELNLECQTYYEHGKSLQKMTQEKFPEIYSKFKKSLLEKSPTKEGGNLSEKDINLSEKDINLSEKDINLSDLILEVEKYIQEMRMSFSQGKDVAIQEATREVAIQTEKQAKDHMEDVKENLRTRQSIVDKYYVECVSFLCERGILSSSNAAEYYEKMENEFNGMDKVSDSPKKIKISLVRQVAEMMERFTNTMLEHEKLNSDILDAEDTIEDFESFLKDLMAEADFYLLYNNGKIDYLYNFEHFYTKIELEVAKTKDKENIKQQQAHIKQDIESAQMDLDEIQSNMETLLALAHVQSETQLRTLIETQKQRDQIIHNSLALEESFSSIDLPKFVNKSINPCKRQYMEDLIGNANIIPEFPEFPEIFEYFDNMTKKIWQEELSNIKKNHDELEDNEHEIQNQCGVLQAKCDALIQSASLAHLRCEQLEIEEKIEEAYERWLELSFAKKIIKKARKQYEQNRQPEVITMASDFFATITNNAWGKIVVSIDDKNIKVIGRNGTLVSPEMLSQGAKEQLYLSLRLAHIQNRAQTHQNIPILMDDILVNFDKNRIENTIEALGKLIIPSQKVLVNNTDLGHDEHQIAVPEKNMQGQQILFYTCHESTAQMLQDNIPHTKIYLLENKTVRPA